MTAPAPWSTPSAARRPPRRPRTLTLAEFDTRFRAFLLDGYHRRENAETKTPPAERWESNGFLPRMPNSLEQLDLLLIQVAKARQVRADGIHFQSLRYISTTLAAYARARKQAITFCLKSRRTELRLFNLPYSSDRVSGFPAVATIPSKRPLTGSTPPPDQHP
jgi:hypothetical protein